MRFRLAFVGLLLALPCALAGQETLSIDDLRTLSIDQLADLEVISVSRQAEPVGSAPASIFVITAEDIRRSGVRSLPEALRLAPSLNVARLDAFNYAISARGFNSTSASNKLLVLVDGRTVYSPLHSGVFWDAQDVPLADVDRIEVISGPGGALWGANAVNGVINIITRRAADTQGLLATGSWGDIDFDGGARYGMRFGENFAARVYGQGFQRGPTINAMGEEHLDEWHRFQGGFRADWTGVSDAFTLQGDVYHGRITGHEDVLPDIELALGGGNVLGRWTRTFSPTSNLEVQAYFDWTRRDQDPLVVEDVNTYDVDAQHSFRAGERHAIVWGAGFRLIDDRYEDLGAFRMEEEDSRRTLVSLFVQDEIGLGESLTLTLGTKLEDHTYTDFEYMPSGRLAWRAGESTLLWTAVSRAVRTPSRIDRELQFPGLIDPAPNFRSETVLAYEAGYRGQPWSRLLLSLSGFYNVYDDLRTTEMAAGGGPTVTLRNGMEGDTYGAEIYAHYRIIDAWRLTGGFTWLEKDLRTKPGVTDASGGEAKGNDPAYWFTVRSLLTPLPGLELDVAVRGVDELHTPPVPGYVELDARIGWRPIEQLELFATGFNLLDEHHREGGAEDTGFRVRRSFAAGFTLLLP